ncbi:hypothetical protein [Aquimarina brevivitae]|nr:hypothetical protein [Aquimarina brevivitae]
MKVIRLFTLLALLAALGLFFFLDPIIVLFLAPFALLTLLYVAPVFPKTTNLRNLAGVKIFIIALVWAGISVLVPAMYTLLDFTDALWLEFIQRFLLVVVIMLPFEIRDLPYDPRELKTIPQQFGVRKTKIIGSLLLLFFVVLDIVKNTSESFEITSSIAIALVSGAFLWGASTTQPRYYCAFWVESIPVMWLTLYTLFDLIKN